MTTPTVTEPVKAIVDALGAHIVVEPPAWLYFPLPPVESYSYIEVPECGRVNLQSLQFSLTRNDPSVWTGMVCMMLFTARALAGLPPDDKLNRRNAKLLSEALARFVPEPRD